MKKLQVLSKFAKNRQKTLKNREKNLKKILNVKFKGFE